MKSLSKALVAFSVLLTAASAAHAQNPYFGTTFDGNPTEPYTDGTIYTAGGADLSGQGGFTATPDIGGTPAGPLAQVFGTGMGDNSGTLSSGAPAVTLSHALGSPTLGGFTFAVDFSISNTGGGGTPGNAYAFNFTNASGNVFSINFQPDGVDGTPQPQLVVDGITEATASQGPVLNQFFHLSVSVSTAGDITAELGTDPLTALTSTTPEPLAADGITGFSISETNVGGGPDFVQFDNIVVAIPEPSTYAMMGLGLLGVVSMMKFRRLKA